MKKIILCLTILILLTGCGNYQELESIGIATSLLFDYVDDEYIVNVEIQTKDETNIYKGKGKSIVNALENAASESKYNLYFAHLDCVFITKNINIEEVTMFLLRNNEISLNLYLILVNDTNIYNENKIGSKVKRILSSQNANNFFSISHSLINNKTYIVPEYNNEKIENYQIVNNNNYLYTLSNEEYKLIKLLNNKKNFNYLISKENGYFEVKIDKNKTSIKNKNNKIIINSNLSLDINEYSYYLDTTNKNDIIKLEELINNNIKNDLNNLFNKLKDINILNIDNYNNNNIEINIKSSINKKGLFRK